MGGRPVLFVSYSGVLGGAERVLLDCATRLGRPALVACPEGPLAEAARAAALPVAALRERSARRRGAHAAAAGALAALTLDVARLARRARPAVVVAWSARAVLAVAAAPLPRGTKVVAVHHDFPPDRIVGGALRVASRRAGTIVATSDAVARPTEWHLRSRGGNAGAARRAVILHPGVDLEAWRSRPLPPADPPRALVLGALVPWKRADLALEIAARVPGLRLTVAGAPLPGDNGAFEAALRRRAQAADLHGRVEFTGAVEDPREAVAAAHCLLHCADCEPYGLVLLEALASGRPVVAPAAGGPLEIVTPGAGRLYAPGDAGSGAEALLAVLANPDPDAARRRAEAFPVEASAARFAEAIA
jgi:glycosyltransferase involved in cell wall biosynthesis